jgi:hypothetical protein
MSNFGKTVEKKNRLSRDQPANQTCQLSTTKKNANNGEIQNKQHTTTNFEDQRGWDNSHQKIQPKASASKKLKHFNSLIE